MKRGQALPGKYLSKDDFDPPVLAQIASVSAEMIEGDDGARQKPVLYIMGPSRPIDVTRGVILNGTNWDSIVAITGEDDSDNWTGKQIVLYHDPNVMFGRQKIGGIRIRAPKQAGPASAPTAKPVAKPQPKPEPQDEPPPLSDDEIPF